MSDSTKKVNNDLHANANEVAHFDGENVTQHTEQKQGTINRMKYEPIMNGHLVAHIDVHGELILQTDTGQHLDAKATIQHLTAEKRLLREMAIVWIPTQQVLMTQVNVPGKRKNHWLAALPYAMEETLSASLDEYHILPLHRDAQNQVSAIAVSLETMHSWKALLQEHGLDHALLVADCFRLPFSKIGEIDNISNETNSTNVDVQGSDIDKQSSNAVQTWLTCFNPFPSPPSANNQSEQNAASEKAVALVRSSVYQGFAADQNWMQVLKSQHTQANNAVKLVEQEVAANALLGSSQSSLFNVKGLSLSQGKFSPAAQIQTGWYEWRWVGVLSVLILAVWMSMQFIETQQIKQQASYTQAQTEKLFKTLFPETKRIVNIKAQTLTKLRQSDNSAKGSLALMPLLQGLEPLFVAQIKVKITDLNWNPDKSNALSLNVQAPSSADLEKLISQAQKNLPNYAMRLSLKNVTSELAEGVIYVDAN